MTGSHAAILLAAGVVAALIGTAGGIASLVSYPALLAVGVPALHASIANSIAVVATWPGAALVSRPELVGRSSWLSRWIPVAAAGGAVGSFLLLVSPPRLFERVVPALVLCGSAVLLAQPRLSARRGYGHDATHRFLLPSALFVVSVYNGYFGAGSGVMLLALMLFTTRSSLPEANALKNMLVGAAAVVSAVGFAIFGPVDWPATVLLGAGMFVGSTLGPAVARRLPARAVRWLAAALGVALAIELWVGP